MPRPLSRSEFLSCLNNTLLAADREPILDDSSQWAIVQTEESDRVLQILAGPGSGKTEMIVWRILFELFVNEVPPDRVIATTFTRKATTELQVRITERSESLMHQAVISGIPVFDPHIHDLRIGTIHSLCDELLAEFDSDYMEEGIQIIDEFETRVRLLREYRFALGFVNQNATPRLVNRLADHPWLVRLFAAPWDNAAWPSSNMDRVTFLEQIIAQHTETWIPRCEEEQILNGVEPEHGYVGLTLDLMLLQNRWEGNLLSKGVLDFTTIQKVFASRQSALVGHFSHIFVDEFQDTNPIQFNIHTAWLDGQNTKLTIVGDDDQAIYRFRGSDISCFQGVRPYCDQRGIPYRLEKLEVNHRSTNNIVGFSEAFRRSSSIAQNSMQKQLVSSRPNELSASIRLLSGPWQDVCSVVASELDARGLGVVADDEPPESAAILMFSTSERSTANWTAPADVLRTVLEQRNLRVYNPRNKTAGDKDSHVGNLLGLLSYLIDPVSRAPVGAGGRMVEVWASARDANKSDAARSVPPGHAVNDQHVSFQKSFIKANGGTVGSPAPDRAAIVSYVDRIRTALAALPPGRAARLTLAGLVGRLLVQPFFQGSGFTMAMFRQAKFTQLLEAAVAPSRLSLSSLDDPLSMRLVNGRYEWDNRFWSFLGQFGAILAEIRLDDPEVEAFEEFAVPLITFHQSKGLEFDHVYVGGAGREPDVTPALRTLLFSGERPIYSFVGGVLTTNDATAIGLSAADRDREVYVAQTRAKQTLTFIHDSNAIQGFGLPNPTIAAMFSDIPGRPHAMVPTVEIKEWTR